MDKNQITGLVLIGAIMLAYFTWFAPDTDKLKNEKQTELIESTSIQPKEEVASSENDSEEIIPDSLIDADLKDKFGIFANIASGNKTLKTVETSNLTIDFSSKGGQVETVKLNQYKSYDKKDLVLIDTENHSSNIKFYNRAGKSFNLNDFYFTPKVIYSDKDSSKIEFTAIISESKKIVRSYKVNSINYTVEQQINFQGISQNIDDRSVKFDTKVELKHLEKSMKESRRKTWTNYYTTEDGHDDFTSNSLEQEIEKLDKAKWIGFKQSFFTTGYISNDGFNNIELGSISNENDTNIVKILSFTSDLDFQKIASPNGLKIINYYGPNQQDILEAVPAEDFDKNIDFGWPVLREVNKYAIYPIFRFLEGFIPNYGLVILLLVIIIKGFLLPLTYSSQMGMAKMKVLKPEIDALTKKYENDKQKSQVETMNLYKQFGVNPMAGCIPMLLQMPVLFAMFRLFPNIIELRQKSFLWADDLSSYDTLFTWSGHGLFLDNHLSMFTLLMTVSTIIYTHFNNQITTQTQPGMKTMSYMMPLVFFFVLNSYASGLTYYYFLSNLFTIAQTIIIRKLVDDDKIRTKLNANKVKNANKSKSSFQNTLAAAMKKQEEKAKNKKKK